MAGCSLPQPLSPSSHVQALLEGLDSFSLYFQSLVLPLSHFLPGSVGALNALLLGVSSSEGQGKQSRAVPVTTDSNLLLKLSWRPRLGSLPAYFSLDFFFLLITHS